MISLNVQIGSNPLIRHQPKRLIYTPSLQILINGLQSRQTQETARFLTVGSSGEIVSWVRFNLPINTAASEKGIPSISRIQEYENKDLSRENEKFNQTQQQRVQANFFPIYQIIPSIDGDSGKLISCVCWPLKVLHQQQTSLKIITLHQDNRLRIWQYNDGTCCNISTNALFPQKVIGLVDNRYHSKKNHKKIVSNTQGTLKNQEQQFSEEQPQLQTRFVLAFGQQSIFIVDSWQMKLVKILEPQVQTYVSFKKGHINQKKELQLLDNHNKTYRITELKSLFSEKFIDVGSYVSNNLKAFDQLQKAFSCKPQIVEKYKRWNDQSQNKVTHQIINKMQDFLKKEASKNQIFQSLDLPRIFSRHESNGKAVTDQQIRQFNQFFISQQPTVSNLFFIKSNRLWYFIGTKSGKIIGFPVIKTQNKAWAILFDHPCKYPVKYIHLTDNFLIISWENGYFAVYTVDNHDYIIDQQNKKRKELSSAKFANSSLFVDIGQSQLFSKKLPFYVKYSLKIHSLLHNHSSTMRVNSLIAYQLNNNQVILVDQTHKKIEHFCGISEDPSQRIYAVFIIQDHIAIAHTSGVDFYDSQKFEREIGYDQWIWNQFSIVQKIQWPENYHSFEKINAKGTDIIEFCNRFYFKKVDYYAQSSLLYQSFGIIDDGKLQNDIFPVFQFQQRIYCESSVHSRCGLNATSILKLKSDNIRRDYWANTSFILNGNLNRQIQSIENSPETSVAQDFIFYSLFGWEIYDNEKFEFNHLRFQGRSQNSSSDRISFYLKNLIEKTGNSFVLKKRFVQQGIGKTFTIYFDYLKDFNYEQNKNKILQNKEKVSDLSQTQPILTKVLISSQNFTLNAIATTAFLQACSNKFFQVADEMVLAVQRFSDGRESLLNVRSVQRVFLNPQILSKIALSENQNIMKACMNLLMSTVLADVTRQRTSMQQKTQAKQKVLLLHHQFVEDLNSYKVNAADSPLRSPSKAFKRLSQNKSDQEKNLRAEQIELPQKSGINLHPNYDYFILNMKNIEQSRNKLLSSTQAHWIVLMGICIVYGVQKVESQQVRTLVGRIMESIDLLNFQLRPDLVMVVMRVLAEGISKWKTLLNSQQIIKFLTDLFRIFFYYDGIHTVPLDDKKFNFCFEKVSPVDNKKMKQAVVRTIIYISKQFNSEFLQVLRNEALSQKIHLAYPSSVIEILRQYIKSEKPSTHLVFFIQLLLQCLSPMTPQLRKYVQKNVLATLQLMCSYKTVSFNQPSQKLSLLTQSHIYIYCLRTSTKWRTINIKNEQGKERDINITQKANKAQKLDKKYGNLPPGMVLQMSPKGTYIALLSCAKLQVWRLSSGFWSGVLGAFSQGWNFEAQGNALKWDESEESITVINPNPSKNRNYKL